MLWSQCCVSFSLRYRTWYPISIFTKVLYIKVRNSSHTHTHRLTRWKHHQSTVSRLVNIQHLSKCPAVFKSRDGRQWLKERPPTIKSQNIKVLLWNERWTFQGERDAEVSLCTSNGNHVQTSGARSWMRCFFSRQTFRGTKATVSTLIDLQSFNYANRLTFCVFVRVKVTLCASLSLQPCMLRIRYPAITSQKTQELLHGSQDDPSPPEQLCRFDIT